MRNSGRDWINRLLGRRVPSLPRGEAIGRPNGWTPASEAEHFMDCPVCAQTFDMRDLGQALEHWHEGPLDDRRPVTKDEMGITLH